jgi:hypothetical protein
MDNTLKILSWNICWGCMVANEKSQYDTTARTLALACKDLASNKIQSCLDNVVKLIDHDLYDIIGLQEAANYTEIQKKSSNLTAMGCIHHALDINKNKIDLTTFYNPQKFKVLAVKVGNIDIEDYDGRPYHIIFLEYIRTKDKYIIINLHNGRIPKNKFDKEPLEKRLGLDIEKLFIVPKTSSNKDFIDIDQNPLSDGSSFLSSNTFKTIVLGDFNDHERPTENYWTELQPFKYTSFVNLQSIIISSIIKPPKTCCKSGRSLGILHTTDDFIGDYILIDSTLEYIKNNTIVEYFKSNVDKLSSDHQPIYAIIKTPDNIPNDTPDDISSITEIEKKSFKLNKTSRTLRLLDDPHDPNDSNYTKQLRGLTIDNTSILIYPPQNIEFKDDLDKKIYMYVVDKNNPDIIGYIKKEYLQQQIDLNEYKVESNRTLRLLANPIDPNVYPKIDNNYHKGATISPDNILILPNGQVTDNKFVLICDSNDYNKVGYINIKYLSPILISDKFYHKYLKYKNKYLQYKKHYNNYFNV